MPFSCICKFSCSYQLLGLGFGPLCLVYPAREALHQRRVLCWGERAVDQKTQEPTFEAYGAEVISSLDLINSAQGSGPGRSCGFLAELS